MISTSYFLNFRFQGALDIYNTVGNEVDACGGGLFVVLIVPNATLNLADVACSQK